MSLPSNLRLRPDLLLVPEDASRGTWVVKDPISLRFFLFGADEHFILQRLDGSRSIAQLQQEFARLRAPQQLTTARIQSFLAELYRAGLALSDAPGQARKLLERAERQKRRESLLSRVNLLAIKLPGVNPDRFITPLYRALAWVFSWHCLLLALLLIAAAGTIVVESSAALVAEWPRINEFLGGPYLFWLAVTLAAIKVLHELAHALTCKHFGGYCHEMGLLLLVFTPCLYCNVTDAWTLRNRRQRILISAAGILLELLLAALAVIVWRYTQPGALHSICLKVMFICSVSTVLFNGNPLLKYDGYYILSDLVRMPNLWQESWAYVARRLGIWLLGHPPVIERESPARRCFLCAYAVASTIYRFALTFAILVLMYRLLLPHGLGLLFAAIATSVLAIMLISWSGAVARWSRDPRSVGRAPKSRLLAVALSLAAMIAVVGWLPLPFRVAAPAVLQPLDAQRVYVTTPGVLTDAVHPGEIVAAGDMLAQLENLELRDEYLRIQGALDRAAARTKTLTARANDEPNAAAQLLVAKEILSDLTEQARLRQRELASLTLRSPAAGKVIAADPMPRESTDAAAALATLPTWTGSPLELANRGCVLNRGVLLCLVGDPRQCEAVVYVDEDQITAVRVGQTARVRLCNAPADAIDGKIVEIAEINALAAPSQLANFLEQPFRRTGNGATPPGRTAYQVRIQLERSKTTLMIGARGEAHIDVAPQTVFERITAWLNRTLTLSPSATSR